MDEDDIQQPEANPEVNPEVERQNFIARLQGIVGRLEAEATKRVSDRMPLEQRWLEDLGQYHGQYDADTESRLRMSEQNNDTRSKLFLNFTRTKTDAMSARLMDLLFPTDDKNWGIQPTPVPHLTKGAEAAHKAAFQIQEQLKAARQQVEQQQGGMVDPNLERAAREAADKAEQLQKQIEEARTRADLMAAEIDDQLKESLYHAVKRDQIEDACKLGTGITKGPVTGDRVRRGWKQKMIEEQVMGPGGMPQMGPDGQPLTRQVASGEYELDIADGDRPAHRWVDVWNVFPSMDARRPEDSEGWFERHLMNRKKLRALARLKGFDKDAIRRLLAAKPREQAPTYLAQLRNITKDKQQIAGDMYHVWEYSGCLDIEDMKDLARAYMADDESLLAELDDVDELAEVNAVVWFCDGEILKFSVYPYDSGECMYSVFNLVKDESSIFGYGIPWIVRDLQKTGNAALRAMMDNAGLASGPQIVVARSMIEPADGDHTLVPRKVWYATEGLPPTHRAFDVFNIDMHQAELANIIMMAKQFIDDVTGMPALAQGEQGTGVTKTAQGMALLMNSTNVVFRRFVKNFDDDVTTPDIRRMYDWNMQFNPKPEIKGDYEVDARGSSVLLVREMQAQSLMAIATQLGGHPIYGPMLRNREVLRKLFQAMMIPAADVVLSDPEIDAVMAQAAANDAAAQAEAAKVAVMEKQLELEEMKLEVLVAQSNMDRESKEQIELLKRETALIQLAQTSNLKLDELENRLQITREGIAKEERIFASEVAIEQRNAEEARARGEEPDGSGGFVSGGGPKKPEQRPSA